MDLLLHVFLDLLRNLHPVSLLHRVPVRGHRLEELWVVHQSHLPLKFEIGGAPREVPHRDFDVDVIVQRKGVRFRPVRLPLVVQQLDN